MGKGGGSAPSYPNPNATAATQAKYDKEAALYQSGLNNINQITPYGNLMYSLGTVGQSGGSGNSGGGGGTGGGTGTGGGSSSSGGTLGNYFLTGHSSGPMTGRYTVSTDGTQVYGPSGVLDGRSLQNAIASGAVGQYGGNGTSGSPGHSLNGNAAGSAGTGTGTGTGGTGAGGSGNPQWTSTISLSPDQQAILDNQENLQIQQQGLGKNALDQFAGNLSTPYSLGGTPQVAGDGDLMSYQKQIAGDLLSRLNPELDRQQSALENKLVNQGVTQGSEAWNNELKLFGQQRNDAQIQSDLAGSQEAGSLFNRSLAAHQQGVSDYNTEYYSPLNTYQSLMNGVAVQNPQFQGPGNTQVGAPDYQGAINAQYQSKLNAYNANQASSNSMMGSLFGLGGSILGGPLGAAIFA